MKIELPGWAVHIILRFQIYWWLSAQKVYLVFSWYAKHQKITIVPLSSPTINNQTTIWPPNHFLWPARTAGGNLRDIPSSRKNKTVSKFRSKSVFWTNFFFKKNSTTTVKTTNTSHTHTTTKNETNRPQILYMYARIL